MKRQEIIDCLEAGDTIEEKHFNNKLRIVLLNDGGKVQYSQLQEIKEFYGRKLTSSINNSAWTTYYYKLSNHEN